MPKPKKPDRSKKQSPARNKRKPVTRSGRSTSKAKVKQTSRPKRVRFFDKKITKAGDAVWRDAKGRWRTGEYVDKIRRAEASAEVKRKVVKQVGIMAEWQSMTPAQRASVATKARWARAERHMAEEHRMNRPMTKAEAYADLKNLTPGYQIQMSTSGTRIGYVAVRDPVTGEPIYKFDKRSGLQLIAHYRNVYDERVISGKQLEALLENRRRVEATWWIATRRKVGYQQAQWIIKHEYGGSWSDALHGESPENAEKKRANERRKWQRRKQRNRERREMERLHRFIK